MTIYWINVLILIFILLLLSVGYIYIDKKILSKQQQSINEEKEEDIHVNTGDIIIKKKFSLSNAFVNTGEKDIVLGNIGLDGKIKNIKFSFLNGDQAWGNYCSWYNFYILNPDGSKISLLNNPAYRIMNIPSSYGYNYINRYLTSETKDNLDIAVNSNSQLRLLLSATGGNCAIYIDELRIDLSLLIN